MTPNQIKLRRMELGLSVAELAAVLEITENELLQIEAGNSLLCETQAFEDAFAFLEECVEATIIGA